MTLKDVSCLVNTTTYVSSNIIRPGYEYEIRVQAVYIDDIYSTASRAYITTGKHILTI